MWCARHIFLSVTHLLITHLSSDLVHASFMKHQALQCCSELPSGSPLCSGHYGVNYLHDAVQRRVGTDGHVGAAEVVVYGADEAHDVQVIMLLSHSVCDPSLSNTHTQVLKLNKLQTHF